MNRKGTADGDQVANQAPEGSEEVVANSDIHETADESQAQPVESLVGSDEDLKSLRARAAERDRYFEMLQRAQADLENYRKRVQREMESERRFAALPFVRDLLPVVDNVERALEAARASDDVARLTEGIELVRAQLLEVLSRHGVEPIEAVGRPFDPNVHEALLERPDRENADRTVLEEVGKGYQMHDRVVRPSKVVVSAPAGSNTPAEGGESSPSPEERE